MNESANDYYEKGLLMEIFHAERNILIWRHVADEIEFLSTQKQEVQKLYSFVQESAQTNFVLCLGKLYDTPNKKHPNRCILSFLKSLELSSTNVPIIETTNTKRLLFEFNCPDDIAQAIDNENYALFPVLLGKHYLDRYQSANMQKDIEGIKKMRDKAVAHNEKTGSIYLEFEIVERLLIFASELVSIFGMAYHSTIWQTSKYSFIKRNAENNAFFVKASILDLKK